MSKKRPSPGIFFWLIWVIITTLGWMAGFTIHGLLQNTLLNIMGSGLVVVAGALFITFFGNGLIIGLLQWLLLRRYLPRSGWWTLASMPGWALAWTLNFVVPIVMLATGTRIGNPTLLFSMLSGAAGGLVTGGLQWMVIRRQVPAAWLWVFMNIISMPAGMYAFQSIPLASGNIIAARMGGMVAGVLTASGMLALLRTQTSHPRSAPSGRHQTPTCHP